MKLKRHKRSNTECPLNNPNIGIIPENDHLVGNCLCQFCKCGNHICPKNRHLKNQYLSDSFQTSYSRHFKKACFDVPYKVHPIPYRPNTKKMDFTTTNSIEYKPYPVSTPNAKPGSSYSPIKTSLFSTTAYSYDFPNWGIHKINYEKGWHAPVRSTESHFEEKLHIRENS